MPCGAKYAAFVVVEPGVDDFTAIQTGPLLMETVSAPVPRLVNAVWLSVTAAESAIWFTFLCCYFFDDHCGSLVPNTPLLRFRNAAKNLDLSIS